MFLQVIHRRVRVGNRRLSPPLHQHLNHPYNLVVFRRRNHLLCLQLFRQVNHLDFQRASPHLDQQHQVLNRLCNRRGIHLLSRPIDRLVIFTTFSHLSTYYILELRVIV